MGDDMRPKANLNAVPKIIKKNLILSPSSNPTTVAAPTISVISVNTAAN
jgi:hypothetical protein